MKGNVISVFLWDHEVCRLKWRGGYKERFGKVGAEISFNPEFHKAGWDLDPLGEYSISKYLVRQGLSDLFRANQYEGLPRFMSGSLPDSWGNTVFSEWMRRNKIRSSDINSVDKLSFIGRRGMGALEFVPESYSPSEDKRVELEELYGLADQIASGRNELSIDFSSDPGINDLMAVGMSAGGQHPKAIVAIDWESMTIRSGQFTQPESFKQYILKFREPGAWPSAEIEYAYYQMACDCGIDMMPSRLLKIKDVNHFLTERFDRINGEKVHTATLLALNGETDRYEDLFSVSRMLKLPAVEMEQLFRRAIFNYLTFVCDDHDRNFSFLMTKDGKWHISPAYDITFTVDYLNPFIGQKHAMELGGSNVFLNNEVLCRFGMENDIRKASSIISQITEVVSEWKMYAERCNVNKTVSDIIASYLFR